jgi:hydroxymethylpyrimidine/phosphomethylpyrimidine kinase
MQIVLTIAGSDSGGGAGIQADLKTFHQFGVFGTSAIVALTAQNTRGVTAVHPVPLATVRAQLDAIAADLPPAAVKSGMLATAALVDEVAEGIARHALPNYVCDPVMVATSGARLLEADAVRTVRDRLLRLAALVTPNLDEAALLVEDPVETVAQMEKAGRALILLGADAALVKGGHLAAAEAADEVVDVLVTPTYVRRFHHPRLSTTSTHGTGCTLSAAAAAGLALGRPLERAVDDALDFVHRAMATAPALGSGHGPLNHFAAAPAADA